MLLYKYNGKELQEEFGLNWHDYGAMNYQADLGRFFNMDRYAESFMSISTYQYAANNPISYIDYNGDYITIGIQDDDGNPYSVLYENGKAYHYTQDSKGNITKGGEYDGDSSFVEKAVGDLNKIAGTTQGGRIVGKLQSSSDGYNIINSGSAESPYFDSNSNTIGYNPNKNYGIVDGVSFNKSHINLGHEIAHAYDKDRGFNMGSTLSGGLPRSELNAVTFENYLRANDGQSKMRLNYTHKGVNHNLSSTLSKGKGFFQSYKDFFSDYIAPLGRDEIYKRITPTQTYNPGIDNTYVKKPSLMGVYNTREQKFISF